MRGHASGIKQQSGGYASPIYKQEPGAPPHQPQYSPAYGASKVVSPAYAAGGLNQMDGASGAKNMHNAYVSPIYSPSACV